MLKQIRKINTILAEYATSKYALFMLLLMSFLESFILPLSPLIVLIPMSLAKPKLAWRYAFYATLASMIGSAIGYILGYFFMQVIEPTIIDWGYQQTLQQAELWFSNWGYWAMLVASIFPIPYKIFTIAAGATGLPFISFLAVSFVVRFLHFALIPVALIFFTDLLHRYFFYKTNPK